MMYYTDEMNVQYANATVWADNQLFRDYKFIVYSKYRHLINTKGLIINDDLYYLIRDKNTLGTYLHIPADGKMIPKGTNIYVAPNCPLSRDSIRAHYNIKRSVDTGDYNVIPTVKNSMSRLWYAPIEMYIFQEEKKIIAAYSCALPSYAFKNNNIQSCNPIRCTSYMYKANDLEIYFDILEGKLKKPCISPAFLDLDNGIELSSDLLTMTLQAAKNASRNSLDDFNVQLAAMHSSNWQKYPKTMELFRHLVKISSYSIRNLVNRRSSSMNKIQTLMMLSPINYEGLSQEDLNRDLRLRGELLNKQLGLTKETHYVSFDDMEHKLRMLQLTTNDIKENYDIIVRIKQKEIQDEDSV